MSAVAEKLSTAERDLLAHAEEKIQRGLETFFETGQALMTVKLNKLYREQFPTFEAYCEGRWGFSDRRANQLVDAVTVLQLISGTVVPEINSEPDHEAPAEPAVPVIPGTERQVRPLAPLLPSPDATPEEKAAAEETIREVWSEAVDTAPRDAHGRAKVTGAHVAEAAAKHTAPEPATTEAASDEEPAKPKAERRKPITDTFRDAVHQLLKDAERIERIVLDDRWPRNAAKAAPASRNDLRRAIDLLAAVADRVPD